MSNHNLYLLVARDAAENPHYIGIYKSRIGQNRAREDIRAYQRTHRMSLGPILGYELRAVKCSPATIKEHVTKRICQHPRRGEPPADAKFVPVYSGTRIKLKPGKDLKRITEAFPPGYAQGLNRFLIEFKPVLPRSGEIYTIERLRVLCAYQLLGKREVINTEGETIVEAVIKDTNLVLPLAFFEIAEEGKRATP